MNKKIFLVAAFMMTSSSFVHGSVFLHNNAGFRLKAVVIGANGVKMGEKVLEAEQTGYVEDYLGQSDPTGQQQTPEGNSSISVTPYTVFWYCDQGALYSTCVQVGAGALAAPNQGQGPMYCPSPKQEENKSSDAYGS